MRRKGSQRGEGKIGCLFWILVALTFGLLAAEVVPIKIATMTLEDHMKELAMTRGHQSSDFFIREIHNKAKELELPVTKKNIRVKKYPERVIMDVEMTVPIEVLFISREWKIHLHLDRDIFWI